MHSNTIKEQIVQKRVQLKRGGEGGGVEGSEESILCWLYACYVNKSVQHNGSVVQLVNTHMQTYTHTHVLCTVLVIFVCFSYSSIMYMDLYKYG